MLETTRANRVLFGLCVLLSAFWAILHLSVLRADTAVKRIPESQAYLTDGCTQIHFSHDPRGVFPHYRSVGGDAGSDIREVYGNVREALISHEDLPLDHDSHDVNFDVHFDRPEDEERLHSSGNANENGDWTMEMEWESKFFPAEFWPSIGDRVWMVGRHIWDCGHNKPAGYKTEFHPPKAVAFTRADPYDPGSGATIWNANRTYVYIHGSGGYFYDPVGGRDYEFDIDPPSGSGLPLQMRVLALPFGGPTPELTERSGKVHVRYPLKAVHETLQRWDLYAFPYRPRPKLVAPRFGAIIAAGFQDPSKQYRRVRVTLNSIFIKDNHDHFKFLGKEVGCSGEFRLWISVQGHWIAVPGLAAVHQGRTYPINRSIDLVVPRGGSITIRSSGWEDDGDSGFGVRSYPFGQNAVADIARLAVNNNDPLGELEAELSEANDFGGLGQMQSTRSHYNPREKGEDGKGGDLDNPDHASEGDFTLNYTVSAR